MRMQWPHSRDSLGPKSGSDHEGSPGAFHGSLPGRFESGWPRVLEGPGGPCRQTDCRDRPPGSRNLTKYPEGSFACCRGKKSQTESPSET